MDILGSIGKLYTFILLVLLFLGSGLAVWAGINAMMNKKDKINEKKDQVKKTLNTQFQKLQNNDISGGFKMNNNGFIKLAVFSLVGIIISAAILAALPKYGSSMSNMNMNAQYTTSTMGMQGMSSNTMQSNMSGSMDLSAIQQQLNNMQQQIYQLQNQMNNSMSNMQNNSGSSMNSSSMNSNNMNNSNMNNSSSGSSSMSSMPMM